MNRMTKFLLAAMIPTTIIQSKLAFLCFFAPEDALHFFELTNLTADLNRLFLILGSFVALLAAIQILAMVWLVRKRKEAFALCLLIGLMTLTRGLVMFIYEIGHVRFVIAPAVLGMVITTLSLILIFENKKSAS